MTPMTPRKNPLRPRHEDIKFVNNEPTCAHGKRMVWIPKGKTGEGFWACEYKKGKGSCERYLFFDEVDKVKPHLPHEATRTPRTAYKQQSMTQYFQLLTPSTERRSESCANPDGQDKETDPTRPPETPTRRTTPPAGSETVIASASTSSGILGGKRPISPDTPEDLPSKKHQSGFQPSKDPIRLLFPPTIYNRAENESHTNENDPSQVVGGENKLGRKSSEEHASSQTSDGGSATCRRVAMVPLGDADPNRV